MRSRPRGGPGTGGDARPREEEKTSPGRRGDGEVARWAGLHRPAANTGLR